MKRAPKSDIRIVYNRLLGGWYIVRGPHDTPIGGRFATRDEAYWHLIRHRRDCCPFHDSGGDRSLSCGGDLA